MSVDISKAKFVRRAGIVLPFATKPTGDLPSLTGTVRPCSAADRGKFFDSEYQELKATHGHERAVATLYARHLVSWAFFDTEQHEQPLAITADNVASLPPAVFDQLDGIISGVQLGN